jgi:hypothetical protein
MQLTSQNEKWPSIHDKSGSGSNFLDAGQIIVAARSLTRVSRGLDLRRKGSDRKYQKKCRKNCAEHYGHGVPNSCSEKCW